MDPRFTPEFIDELVDFINSKVNIPLLSEEAEAMVFKAMLTAIFQLLSKVG